MWYHKKPGRCINKDKSVFASDELPHKLDFGLTYGGVHYTQEAKTLFSIIP